MLLYWILLPIVWVLAHIVFRIQVIGRECRCSWSSFP